MASRLHVYIINKRLSTICIPQTRLERVHRLAASAHICCPQPAPVCSPGLHHPSVAISRRPTAWGHSPSCSLGLTDCHFYWTAAVLPSGSVATQTITPADAATTFLSHWLPTPCVDWMLTCWCALQLEGMTMQIQSLRPRWPGGKRCELDCLGMCYSMPRAKLHSDIILAIPSVAASLCCG